MTYIVRMIIEVDRPALRGAGYLSVAAGHRMTSEWRTESHAGAVAEMARCLRGACDTAGEFVVKVSVEQRRPGKSLRTVRRQVVRDAVAADRRGRSWWRDRELRVVALAVLAITRGNGWRNLYLPHGVA